VQVPATGWLLALAEARHGDCSDAAAREIAARTSYDGGLTWGPIRVVAGGRSATEWLGNPAVVATRSGRLLLTVSRHSPGCGGNCVTGDAVTTSDDGGFSWSVLTDIEGLGTAGRSRAGPGLGLLIERGPRRGRVLVPASTGTYGSDYAYVTDDEGRSFRAARIHSTGVDEAQATQLPDGRILMIMRHEDEGAKGKAAAVSEDGGASWGPIHYLPQLRGPVCQASVTTFANATFFAGPDSSVARERLTVRRSDDSATSWARTLLIDPGCAPSPRRCACCRAASLPACQPAAPPACRPAALPACRAVACQPATPPPPPPPPSPLRLPPRPLLLERVHLSTLVWPQGLGVLVPRARRAGARPCVRPIGRVRRGALRVGAPHDPLRALSTQPRLGVSSYRRVSLGQVWVRCSIISCILTVASTC
jgi:sialidase-1